MTITSAMRSLSKLLACIYVGVGLATTAHAQLSNDRVHVDIPAQNLSAALTQFGRDTGTEIVFAPEAVNQKVSAPVKGDFAREKAIAMLLAGTGLTYRVTAQGAIVVDIAASLKSSGINASDKSAHLAQAPNATSSSSLSNADTQSVPSSSDTSSSKESNDDGKGLAEILVRGSKIQNVDVKRTEDDPQPYYILDSQQIQQSGATNVEDFLKQQLTMNTVSQSNNQRYNSNLGTTSSINLRGLGTNETLVLIDGRRSAGVSNSGAAGQPDINGIPLSAIERIEVLPSSASAIYGGAAMGGVVNIILKKNYEGGDLSYSFENTMSGHAPIRTLNAAYGFSLFEGKTQVMLAGHYSDGDVLLTQDRLGLIGRNYATIYRNSPGYFSSDPSIPVVGATPNIGTADGVTNLTLKSNGAPLNSPIATLAPGTSVASAGSIIPGQWNTSVAQAAEESGPSIAAVPRVKSLMASIRQELTSSVDLFTNVSTASNIGVSQFRAIDTSGGGVFVPASSPINPFNQDVNVSFPNTPLTPYFTDSVTHSATVGLVGRLPGDWKSEFDYTWSQNSYEYTSYTSNDTALASAVADGTVNPFVDTIAHPLDLAPYLAPLLFTGRSTLNDLGLRASGPVLSLPWGRPSLTIGLEHRREALGDGEFDQITPNGPSLRHYFGQSQSTNSVYAEALVPLVTAKNALPGLRSLDLQLAGRSEQYTVKIGTPYAMLASDGSVLPSSPPQGVHTTINYTSTNPTLGVKYKPVEDLIFRASYARAFLPPTASQLLPNPLPTTYTNTVTDPQTGSTYPVHLITGGNPALKPQTARSWDFGLIFEPQESFLNGLRIDLEYYKITQPNYITVPGTQVVVGDPSLASRVTRDPTTGRITLVDVSFLNAEEFKTNGYDLTLDYRKSTPFGTFSLHGVGTMVQHDQRQYSVGSPSLDYVGYPGESGEAKFKANGTFAWQYRLWTVGWTTTYFGNYKQVFSPGSPASTRFGTNPIYTDAQGGYGIPSQTYHTLFASYNSGKTPVHLLSNVTVQAGIKNIFNSSPPFDAYYSPYYYSPYGDARLRDYWISLSKAF
jgi:iron complex outermembrane receptor protein